MAGVMGAIVDGHVAGKADAADQGQPQKQGEGSRQ